MGLMDALSSSGIATISCALEAIAAIDKPSLAGASGGIASVNLAPSRRAAAPWDEAAVTSRGIARINRAGIIVITDLRLVHTASGGVASGSEAQAWCGTSGVSGIASLISTVASAEVSDTAIIRGTGKSATKVASLDGISSPARTGIAN